MLYYQIMGVSCTCFMLVVDGVLFPAGVGRTDDSCKQSIRVFRHFLCKIKIDCAPFLFFSCYLFIFILEEYTDRSINEYVKR